MTTATTRAPRAVEVLTAVYADLVSGALTGATHADLAAFVLKYNVPRPRAAAATSEPASEAEEDTTSSSTSSEEEVASPECSETSEEVSGSTPGSPVVTRAKRTRL